MKPHPHSSLAAEYLQAERAIYPTCNAYFVLFFRTPSYPGVMSDSRSYRLLPDQSTDLRWMYGADITTEGLFFGGADSITVERILLGQWSVFASGASMPGELMRPGKLPAGAFAHELPRNHELLLTVRRGQ